VYWQAIAIKSLAQHAMGSNVVAAHSIKGRDPNVQAENTIMRSSDGALDIDAPALGLDLKRPSTQRERGILDNERSSALVQSMAQLVAPRDQSTPGLTAPV